mgnify:FL=1
MQTETLSVRKTAAGKRFLARLLHIYCGKIDFFRIKNFYHKILKYLEKTVDKRPLIGYNEQAS